MVVKLLVKILLGLVVISSPAQGDYGTLIESVLTQLRGNHSEFQNWTQEMSLTLGKAQQERLAWNTPWSQIVEEGQPLLVLQQQLNPSNPLQTRLWLSFYWHLQRSRQLDKILLSNFALKLRQLRRNHPELWSKDLQNMWQSLPRSLRILLHSRRLCLQHRKEMFFVHSGYELELGANSNCSVWQIFEENEDYWQRLFNVCDATSSFFINMLQQHEGTYMLHSAPRNMATKFCVLKGLGYFKVASKFETDCHWQLNDCSNWHWQ